MKRFKTFLFENADLRSFALTEFETDENRMAIAILEWLDNQISSIKAEISLDDREGKSSGKKIGSYMILDKKYRNKYVTLANEIIKSHPQLTFVSGQPSASRASKDFAFKHEGMEKYVYVNIRPDGKASKAGEDPHEFATAALCLMSKLDVPNVDEIEKFEALIEEITKLGGTNRVVGVKKDQIASLDKDYANLAMAISAAREIHKRGYGNADKVYMTGQSWDAAVKKFQITKYGMKDFNSSDFIIQKKNKFLGVSLKKKPRETSSDPTVINKSMSSFLNTEKLAKIKRDLDKKAAEFYIKVLTDPKLFDRFPPQLQRRLKTTRVTQNNWKQLINSGINDIINDSLKGNESLFRDIAKIVIDNREMIAEQLVTLIFKSDLRDLKKFDFDFALVTGVGDYGPKIGVAVRQGTYQDLDSTLSLLDDLFSKGRITMEYRQGKTQAFDPGAKKAGLFFTLKIGNVSVCDIEMRYKGSFSAAPFFLAEITHEFKSLLHGKS